MGGWRDLNLIHFFDFYLAVAFLLNSATRLRQYSAILSLVGSFPRRWPRLLKLVQQHRSIFLTWATLTPGLLALGLTIVQTLASRFVWPGAGQPPHGLTIARLLEYQLALLFMLPLGAGMLVVDIYGILIVGTVDRTLLEKYFDQAEFWLKSWTAPVIHAVTFGFVNPRQMVTTEVCSALINASRLLNSTLWWVSMQIGLRIAYGLALWLTYAWSIRQL